MGVWHVWDEEVGKKNEDLGEGQGMELKGLCMAWLCWSGG